MHSSSRLRLRGSDSASSSLGSASSRGGRHAVAGPQPLLPLLPPCLLPLPLLPLLLLLCLCLLPLPLPLPLLLLLLPLLLLLLHGPAQGTRTRHALP
jgi:hypothetical protein